LSELSSTERKRSLQWRVATIEVADSVLSRAFQNEIHHSAKRSKMRQIEAAKSSRKVVKRVFLLPEFLLQEYHMRRSPGNKKTGHFRSRSQIRCPCRARCVRRGSRLRCVRDSYHPARNIFLFIFVSSCLPIIFSCYFRAFSNSCIRPISSAASSRPRCVYVFIVTLCSFVLSVIMINPYSHQQGADTPVLPPITGPGLHPKRPR